MPPSPLTLIVATTPSLGIGLRGSLPWPPLKSDLAFFARVTKRPPPPFIHPDSLPTVDDGSPRAINAVIMGRKTWDSIPSKFAPLKGRVNVVISRNAGVRESLGALGDTSTETKGADSIGDDVRTLQKHYGREDAPMKLGRVFVIGGASIYEQAMDMESCERILWTWIYKQYECDVYFPGQDVIGNKTGVGEQQASRWEQKSRGELQEWCGEDGVGGVKNERDVEFEVQMWEKTSVQ